jgi:hypothetical protein
LYKFAEAIDGSGKGCNALKDRRLGDNISVQRANGFVLGSFTTFEGCFLNSLATIEDFIELTEEVSSCVMREK